MIETAGKPKLDLTFTLRKSKKKNMWKIFDLVAQGVSLLSSKQAEWSSKIRTEGTEKVSQEFFRLAARPIEIKKEP